GRQPPIPSFRKWLGYAKLFLGRNTSKLLKSASLWRSGHCLKGFSYAIELQTDVPDAPLACSSFYVETV
ncbi:hypothetical protein, partial [Burkholderia sp. Bp8986]|uniref:hypothetical protein n=1 Tax=Burkholderia sp. Bp8986 TaxID=2184550 RepID=UPI001C8A68C3